MIQDWRGHKNMQGDAEEYKQFLSSLKSLPISHVWRGYGSAIIFEFGALRSRTKRDGTLGDPQGEMSLMIEWSWRIESQRRILCGSWGNEARWSKVFALMKNRKVIKAYLFGRLPEIALDIEGGISVISFMTSEPDPAWALFDRQNEQTRWLCVRRGVLCVEHS
jgi:hypothetical protein